MNHRVTIPSMLAAEVSIRSKPASPPPTEVPPREAPYSILFRNDAGATIPAYAIIQPNGVVEVAGRPVVKAIKPSSTPADVYFVNGPRDVESNKYGRCANLPAYALHNPAITPANNQVLGPKSGEWTLWQQKSGFTTLGNPANNRVYVGPGPLASYGGLSGGGQVMTVGAGYTKITALTTSHVAEFGVDVSEADSNITVDRTGAYYCTFTASVRYDTYAGAGPIMALHKNGTGFLGPSVGAQIELNNANYRSVAWSGIVSCTAGDVLDVRVNGPSEDLRFQLVQFTVHLVGIG